MPASAAAPSGHLVEPRARVGEAAAVARQHLHVGQEVMAEGDGLRRLQMGEARHDHVGVRSALRASVSCRRASAASSAVDRSRARRA